MDGVEALVERAVGDRSPPVPTGWQEGLGRFLADLERSRTLAPGARAGIERFAVGTLRARFAIEGWLAENPEAAAAPVERPLFILGMPRAGTTLLLNLLRHDPQRRVYWHWEGNREIPPARTERLLDDPRIAVRVAEVEAMLDSGALPRNHHVELGDEPTECNWILGQDFKAYPWLVQTIVPEYFEWLMHDADMVAAYRYHRQVLRVLQSSAPGRWTLKFPSHAMALSALLEIYPDARIVMTHRDPIKPVASSCSLVQQILSLQNESVDRKAVGYQTLTINLLGAQRMTAARDANPSTQFHDMHYKAFIRDPMATIRALYAFEGMALAGDVEARMQAALYRQAAERKSAGVHHYRLEEYGLDAKGIGRAFGDYIERYQIEQEGD